MKSYEVDLESLESQTRDFCNRCSIIKQKLSSPQEREVSDDFALPKVAKSHLE